MGFGWSRRFLAYVAASLDTLRAPVSHPWCGNSRTSWPLQAPLPIAHRCEHPNRVFLHTFPAVRAVRPPSPLAGLTPVNASSLGGGDGAASCFDGGASYRTDMCVVAPSPPPQSGRHKGRGRSGGTGGTQGQAEDQEEETLSPAVYFLAFAVVASLLWLGYTTRQGIMVGAGTGNLFPWIGRANNGVVLAVDTTRQQGYCWGVGVWGREGGSTCRSGAAGAAAEQRPQPGPRPPAPRPRPAAPCPHMTGQAKEEERLRGLHWRQLQREE